MQEQNINKLLSTLLGHVISWPVWSVGGGRPNGSTLIAAADEGGPDAIAMQVDDPGVGLVRVGEQGLPFYGPMQAYEGLADADPVQRFAGEAGCIPDMGPGFRRGSHAPRGGRSR